MDFLDGYIDFTQYFESPTSFWKWSSFATVAAILRDRIYKQEKDTRVHANIYVLLLADSAVQRKDRPVDMCEKLVRAVKNTKVISGRSSIQAILDELAIGETDPKTGKLSAGGQAILIAPELSAGIVQDPQSVDILTDIYKSRDEYSSRLRGTGKFKIKNLCLSLMSASNRDMIIGLYDNRAMGGGLLGRTMLVTPNEFRPGNSLWKMDHTLTTFDWLVDRLREIAQLEGECIWTETARQEYDTWYIPFRASYEKKSDGSGIAGRIHASIIKLSMILGAARSLDIEISKCHVEEAIDECTALIPNYQQLIMSTGKSTLSETHAIVINEIMSSKEGYVTRKQVLQKHLFSFDAEMLEKSLDTLQQAGMVSITPMNGDIGYKLTEKAIELLDKKGKAAT